MSQFIANKFVAAVSGLLILGGEFPDDVGDEYSEDKNDICGVELHLHDDGTLTVETYWGNSIIATFDVTESASGGEDDTMEDTTEFWAKWTDVNGNGDGWQGPFDWNENTYQAISNGQLSIRVLDWSSSSSPGSGTYDDITLTIAYDNTGTGAVSKTINIGGDYTDDS